MTEDMKKNALAALLLCLSITPLRAADQADTPAARRQEAERYLKATPPKEMFANLAEKTAMNMPPADRQKFKETLTSALDIDALTKAMADATVKHFTVQELKALADFYGSPVGKSAMSKFGDYMADVMPTIQAEMIKAQAKANQSAPNP